MGNIKACARTLAITIDRRILLLSGTAAASALVLGIAARGRDNRHADAPDDGELGAWLRIDANGRVTVRVNSVEMGQGAQTGLAQIVCEELDGDWNKVHVEMAPVTETYFVKRGEYFTGGSSSIRPQFELFRNIGATARAMLIAAAAKQWQVAAESCTARNGAVLHVASKRTANYGALAGSAARMPLPHSVQLKEPAVWTLIGKSPPRIDLPRKVTGEAIYGIDVKRPGMRVAAIRQCPYFSGKLEAVDEAPAHAIKGVRQVVKLADAVAVVGDNYWAAKKGCDALLPNWTKPANAIASDPAMMSSLRTAIGAAGSMIATKGDGGREAVIARVERAMASAPKVVEAEYQLPLLAHAAMEPMNATAEVGPGRCELWLPTQVQSGVRAAVASALTLSKDAVVVNTTQLGGGFGRRLETDYAVQAALIARDVGRPVKLIWSREEDLTHDFYRPACVGRMKAALDDQQRIVALDYSGATTNDVATGGMLGNYEIADIVVRQKNVALPLTIGAWRSVDPSITIFLLESLIDEIAHGVGIDALAYRRTLLKSQPRELRVLEKVAELAKWGHAPAGRFHGLAYFGSTYWGTAVAEIVELSLDARNKITLHKVYCAIDPGTAINPAQVAAQAQGGIVMGLSAALGEAITVKDGQAEQKNFNAYSILRFAEAPQIVVSVLESDGVAPGGVGEPPVPPAAPALANAVFAATGKRVRTLPLAKSGFSV